MLLAIGFYFICGVIIFCTMFFYGIQQLYLRKHSTCFFIIKTLSIYNRYPICKYFQCGSLGMTNYSFTCNLLGAIIYD